ncbi:hypothetical protein JXB31_00555 [Candidatus Woesearchaeota archaeon]|nr:hypothetical protein [Candidatus Woesearchaeota archaeon]
MRDIRAAMGIGSLIIFISLLLVAAISAGVLIHSGYFEQEDTLSTGESTEKQVTTGVKLYDLHATDGSDGSVDDFRYSIKLNPGASAINLKAVVLYVNTYNDTLRLVYKEGDCKRDVADGYYTIR